MGFLNDKKFKSFDEQISLLKERNLSFLDNNGKNVEQKFKWYLEKFNYHNIINEYSFPVKWNNDSNNLEYKPTVNAQHILDLFNFDRALSSLLIGDIQSVERFFCTCICHYTIKTFEKELPSIINGKILELKDEDFKIIFPNINTKEFRNILSFKEIFITSIPEYKYKNKSNYKSIPLWELSLYWSFGSTIRIFSSLNLKVKKTIVKQFINKNQISINDVNGFYWIMRMINNFRNVVCHNNPIYLFNYWRGFKSINYFSSSYVKNKIAVEKIRLCDVMKILIFLNPHKKSSKTWEKFDMKVKDLKNKLNSDDIYNELIKFIHYL